jgi:hypothetical protein
MEDDPSVVWGLRPVAIAHPPKFRQRFVRRKGGNCLPLREGTLAVREGELLLPNQFRKEVRRELREVVS